MSATWVFDLVDRNGRGVTSGGLTLARDITITFQGLANPNSLQCTLPVNCKEAALILNNANTQYFIKAYRTPSGGSILNRSLKFYGAVEVDELNGSDLVLTAVDPLYGLQFRFTTATIASQDVGTTIRTIVNTTNTSDGETGVQTDSTWVTASVSQAFDGSQNNPSVLGVLQDYAKQQDGPDSWVSPIEYASGKIGRLYVSPNRGTNSAAVFGYGDGTVGNCRSMGRVIDRSKVANDVRPTGDSLVGTPQTNATSISAMGRRVEYVAYTGDTVLASINAKARGRLNRRSRPSTIAEYTVDPDYGAPALFDDFQIGDVVTLDYRNGVVRWTAKPRVLSATVRVNLAGHEQPADVAFYDKQDVA